MEEFFYAANGHALGRPDGEVEYSAEATAAAHAIGRVTCPPDGVDNADEPIDFARCVELVGADVAEQARAAAIALYERGNAHANERGIVIADTKFEFGLRDGQLVLIDECLTPDSSRFWPADEVSPGGKPTQYDKQQLRDWLLEQRWDRSPSPPSLPGDVIASTARTYQDIQRRLTT